MEEGEGTAGLPESTKSDAELLFSFPIISYFLFFSRENDPYFQQRNHFPRRSETRSLQRPIYLPVPWAWSHLLYLGVKPCSAQFLRSSHLKFEDSASRRYEHCHLAMLFTGNAALKSVSGDSGRGGSWEQPPRSKREGKEGNCLVKPQGLLAFLLLAGALKFKAGFGACSVLVSSWQT